MLSTLALIEGPVAHWGGPGLWWIPPIFGLLWVALIVTVIVLLVRRGGRRGPWGHGWQGGPWAWQSPAARSAETILAERFAKGDIDEKEYRARLEVLRSGSVPPAA